jgi:DNA-directed RNA polymerase subunit RPC12/RpoP
MEEEKANQHGRFEEEENKKEVSKKNSQGENMKWKCINCGRFTEVDEDAHLCHDCSIKGEKAEKKHLLRGENNDGKTEGNAS